MPAKTANPLLPSGKTRPPLAFMGLAGLFFFLAFIKFGDPVVLDYLIEPPKNIAELIYYSWPIRWGYLLMIPVFAVGLFAVQRRPLPLKGRFLFYLPVLWLAWEAIAYTASISSGLSSVTLAHFAACVAFFYLGLFALRGVRNPWPVWAGLALALAWTLHSALQQHNGGLARTREMVHSGAIYVPPETLKNPAYLAKINSDRVFGTFMYPNSLAAGILLLLPITLVFLWQVVPKLRPTIRAVFMAIVGGCALACLYWSGSKAAWLFMVCVGIVALHRSPLPALWKRAAIYGILIIGTACFTYKYVDSASRGKRSMEARLVYWQAALQITRAHPLLGTGPGTFGRSFDLVKPPGAEFAVLAHNDYLEQASDSGIFGFFTYSSMILGLLYYLYRYRILENGAISALHFAVWVGLFGLFLHCLMEFNLYYPALAWPAFFLLGWLSSQD